MKSITTISSDSSSHRLKAKKMLSSLNCSRRKCRICCGRCLGDFHCMHNSSESEGSLYGN